LKRFQDPVPHTRGDTLFGFAGFKRRSKDTNFTGRELNPYRAGAFVGELRHALDGGLASSFETVATLVLSCAARVVVGKIAGEFRVISKRMPNSKKQMVVVA